MNMKSLKEYITEGLLCEGLLDRVKNKEVNHKIFIEEFLEENYKIRGSYTVNDTNKRLIIDVNGDIDVKNANITTLTNEFFEFGKVSGYFRFQCCSLLESLEGAPKEVGTDFDCLNCKSLKSLKGAPEKVGGSFHCTNCDSLTSLKGAPKKVRGSFNCGVCKSLKTLEDAP